MPRWGSSSRPKASSTARRNGSAQARFRRGEARPDTRRVGATAEHRFHVRREVELGEVGVQQPTQLFARVPAGLSGEQAVAQIPAHGVAIGAAPLFDLLAGEPAERVDGPLDRVVEGRRLDGLVDLLGGVAEAVTRRTAVASGQIAADGTLQSATIVETGS